MAGEACDQARITLLVNVDILVSYLKLQVITTMSPDLVVYLAVS